MILFAIYDKLNPAQKDFIQVIDNDELLKRDMLSRYRKMIKDNDSINLDKFKDHNIIFYGEIKDGVISVYDKDKMKDISLISFLGLSEVKANECKGN